MHEIIVRLIWPFVVSIGFVTFLLIPLWTVMWLDHGKEQGASGVHTTRPIDSRTARQNVNALAMAEWERKFAAEVFPEIEELRRSLKRTYGEEPALITFSSNERFCRFLEDTQRVAAATRKDSACVTSRMNSTPF